MWTGIQKNWSILFNGAIWLCGIVATFVVWPSFLDKTWTNLSHFIVAIAVGLLLLFASGRTRRKDVRTWVILTLIFLACAVISFVEAQSLTSRWSVTYPPSSSTRVLIGKTYKDIAQSYREQFKRDNGRYPTDEDLVWKNSGPDGLWLSDEVETRNWLLALVYIADVVFPACCIIAVTQAIASATHRQGR